MLHLVFCPKKTGPSRWSMIKLNPNVNIQKLLHYLCLKTSTISPPHQGTDEKQELQAEARMNRWPVFYMPLIWLIYLDLLGCINILFLSLRVGIQDDQAPACYHIRFPTIVFLRFLLQYYIVIHVWHHAEMEHHESKKINPWSWSCFLGNGAPHHCVVSPAPMRFKRKAKTRKVLPMLPRVPYLCLDFAWMILRRHTSALIRTRLQEAPICTIWRYDGRKGDTYKKGPLRKMLEYKGLLLPMFACRNL